MTYAIRRVFQRLKPLPLVLMTAAAGLSGEFEAGSETGLQWEGLEDPLRVFVPDNYDADESAPVIFFYHGTNGRPEFGGLLEYTRRRDFVIVGMTYRTRGRLDGSEKGLRAELDQLLAVRDHLGKRLNLDGRRIYISGFSKGGWLASMVSDFGLGQIRGALILGAGKAERAPDLRPAAAKRRLAASHPIYVGIGQWDGNYVSALRCIRYFSEIGGAVTFDVYPGLAHNMGRTSEYLEQWLAVEAAGEKRMETVGRKAKAWWMKRRAQLAKLAALEKYLLLRHVMKAPYFGLLDETAKKEIGEIYEAVMGDPELEEELFVESRFLEVLGSELGDGTLANVMDAMRKYREIALASPRFHFGKVAHLQWMRSHSLMENTMANPLPAVAESPEFRRLSDNLTERAPDAENARDAVDYFRDLESKLFEAR